MIALALRLSVASVLVASGLVGATGAAQPRVPAGPASVDEAARYRFDLERNFFASPEAEVAARADVENAVRELIALTGRPGSAQDLLRALQVHDRMEREFRRHDLYLFLRYAIDIRREAAMADSDRLRERVREGRRALRAVLARHDATALERAIAEAPGLAKYRFAFETARREKLHELTPAQQAVVSALEPAASAGDYSRIVNAIDFGSIDADGRPLAVGRQQSEIEAHPSAAVRREGVRRFFAGYAAKKEVLAYALVHSVQARHAIARLKGFKDAADEAATERYLTPERMAADFAAIRRRAPGYKRWQARSERSLSSTARWTPSQAITAVTRSAAPLGPAYQREVAELLDPASGRADMAGGDNRVPYTGTSSVYPIGTSAIYMHRFNGYLLDLLVLAHEGGHAVQAMLMHRAGVPMIYAAGPGYFTESFGRFQELLLLDHLVQTTADPALKRQFRDALAERLLAVYPSTEEAAVELAIYKAVEEGKARTADDLDRITAEAGGAYSLRYEQHPERKGLWQVAEGYYLAPLFTQDNPYASLLAVRYFQLWRRDPARFRDAYTRLLSNGYDAPPDVLLKRFMNLDVASAGFVDETLAALDQEVDALYRP